MAGNIIITAFDVGEIDGSGRSGGVTGSSKGYRDSVVRSARNVESLLLWREVA